MPCYLVHGLRVESDRALPGPLTTDPEVVFESGALEKKLPEATYTTPLISVGTGVLQLDLPGIARYRVTRERIVVDGRGLESDVLLFLLNRAFPALMLLRGCVPLQASGVVLEGKVTLLCGDTVRCKSVIAATLRQRGRVVHCDGVAYLEEGQSGVFVRAGLPFMHLWHDALAALGETPGPLLRPAVAANRIHLLPLSAPPSEALPLGRLLVMGPSEWHGRRVEGGAQALSRLTLLNHFIPALGCRDEARQLTARLAEHYPPVGFAIPWGAMDRATLERLADSCLELCA